MIIFNHMSLMLFIIGRSFSVIYNERCRESLRFIILERKKYITRKPTTERETKEHNKPTHVVHRERAFNLITIIFQHNVKNGNNWRVIYASIKLVKYIASNVIYCACKNKPCDLTSLTQHPRTRKVCARFLSLSIYCILLFCLCMLMFLLLPSGVSN